MFQSLLQFPIAQAVLSHLVTHICCYMMANTNGGLVLCQGVGMQLFAFIDQALVKANVAQGV